MAKIKRTRKAANAAKLALEHQAHPTPAADHEHLNDGIVYDPTAEVPKLPVVMVHGMHARDFGIGDSPLWGRIPQWLRNQGNSAWFGNTDAWGSVEGNAIDIVNAIHEVLRRTGAPKVHLIAHSKGVYEARHAVHMDDMDQKIASFVALAPPNHGVRLCSFLSYEPLIIPKIVLPIMVKFSRKMGDVHPEPLEVLKSLGIKRSNRLLEMNPDIPGIEYRNYGFVPHLRGFQHLAPRRLLFDVFDGRNDGLVSIKTTEGTHWCLIDAQDGVPFNHDDSYDLNREDWQLTMPDGYVYANCPDLVADMVKDLDRKAAGKPSITHASID